MFHEQTRACTIRRVGIKYAKGGSRVLTLDLETRLSERDAETEFNVDLESFAGWGDRLRGRGELGEHNLTVETGSMEIKAFAAPLTAPYLDAKRLTGKSQDEHRQEHLPDVDEPAGDEFTGILRFRASIDMEGNWRDELWALVGADGGEVSVQFEEVVSELEIDERAILANFLDAVRDGDVAAVEIRGDKLGTSKKDMRTAVRFAKAVRRGGARATMLLRTAASIQAERDKADDAPAEAADDAPEPEALPAPVEPERFTTIDGVRAAFNLPPHDEPEIGALRVKGFNPDDADRAAVEAGTTTVSLSCADHGDYFYGPLGDAHECNVCAEQDDDDEAAYRSDANDPDDDDEGEAPTPEWAKVAQAAAEPEPTDNIGDPKVLEAVAAAAASEPEKAPADMTVDELVAAVEAESGKPTRSRSESYLRRQLSALRRDKVAEAE